jgi:gliding motility-associated-like protein
MKFVGKIKAVLFLLVCGVTGFSQNISNKGKEFWVGYGHHQYMEPGCTGGTASNDMNMVLYLSAEEPAIVTVTIDSSSTIPTNWWRKTYTIPANTVISTENLPKGVIDAAGSASNPNYDARLITDPPPAGTGGEGIFRRKGIHIESNVPIVAYAHIYGGVSSGATMLLPIESWGYTYTSVNSEQRDADRSYSWMYVVAKENNTRVQITPSAQSRLGKPANVPFTVNLQKGQIYQLIGDAVCNTGNGPELTGTTVTSVPGSDGICHAVAVFSGSSRTGGETLTCGTGSGRDNDMQQAFPERAWGKRYLTAPFSKSSSSTLQPASFQTSVYKVVVKDPNTVVLLNGNRLTNLIGGKYYRYSSAGTDYIESDKPVLVAQFMSGTSSCNGGQGDPEMVYLSPIEQAIKRVGFYRNTKEAITQNYVTLIVPTAGVPSLRIDGSSTFSHTYPHSKPGYTVVIKGWQAAPAQCLVVCDSAFTGVTYGLGGAESYGYNVGTYFNILSAISNFHNVPDTSGVLTSHPVAFVGTPTELGAIIAYKPTKMIWKLSALGTNITPNADVTVLNPTLIDSVLVGSAWYYRYRLPGTYTFNKADSFYIPILLSSNIAGAGSCLNDETAYILVVVKPRPVANFTYTVRGCGKDTINFTTPATVNGEPVIQYKWTFPNGDTSNLQNPQYVLDTGRHQVKLTITVKYGGIADTTITIVVPPKPVAKLAATPGTVCFNQPIVFSDSTVYAGITSWYWDFGNQQTLNATTNANQTINYAASGTYVVKHAVRVSQYCLSDTVTKTVVVSPEAVIAFSYPTNCLPASGLAQFAASATDLGGQPITSYSWNFGDNYASAANNISSLQNPSHTYTVAGSYTVKLNVETNTGCTGDTSVVISMNVRASMTYPALSSICMNAGVIKVDSARVTNINAVQGAGYYSGPGTDSLGNFNPAVAGAGTHTIYYIFTTTGNCTDSVSTTITVSAVPAKPVVVSPVNYCQNATAIQLSATAATNSTLTWYNNASLTNGTPTAPTPSTGTAGTYNYYVTQSNTAGCKSDTSVVRVNITPALSGNTIGSDQAICSADTVATINGSSTVAGGTGTYTYQWQLSTDGGVTWTDLSGSTSASFNPGTLTGINKFRRIITSGLCSDISNIVTIGVSPAITNINITGTQVVCAGIAPSIIDGEAASAGNTTITYQWESSTDSTTWTAIAGATAEDYQPAVLTGSTYYRRQVSNGTCAATSGVVKITVNPTPDAVLTSPTSICVVDSAIATITATGGTAPYAVQITITGPSGPRNITQTIAGNVPLTFTAVPANSTAGSYSVTITSITDSKGCKKSTGVNASTITVNPKPILNVSADAAICAGASTTLTVSGANSYSWTPSTGLNNTTDASVIASPTATTTYTVTGSSNGCAADAKSVTVTVNPIPAKPVVTSAVLYCQNDVATQLYGTATTGNTLTWYNNAALTGGSATAPTPATTTAGTFNYYVTQSSSTTSCKSDTSIISVTINPAISGNSIAADQTICAGENAAAITSSATITGGAGSYSYVWQQSTNSGATWSDIVGVTSASYTPGTLTGVVKFRRIATSGLCTNTSNEITITVLAAIANTDISGTQTICSGSIPTVLPGQSASGGGTITYQWENSIDGIAFTSIAGATSKDYQPTALSATTFFRRKVSNGVCSATSSIVTVTVNAQPGGSITAPSAICVYDTAAVVFTATTGTAPYTVQLSITGPSGASTITQTISGSGQASIKVINANSAAGTYTITISSITDNIGCSKTTGFTPVTITVNPKPVVAVTRDTAICAGSSVQLTASGATSYTWSPSNGLSGYSGGNVTASPSATTTYTVNGIDNGCQADPVSVKVTINPVPSKPVATRPVSYCQDATAIPLAATASAGNTLNWYNNASLVQGSTAAPTPSTATAGTIYYYVSQTNTASGCVSDTTAIPVVINQLPVANFQLPGAICMVNGQGVAQFTNESTMPGGGTYTWNFGDNSSTSNATNPSHTYTSAGPFQVMLTATTLQGCSSDTVKTLPAMLQKPLANFSVAPDTVCQGARSDFDDLSTAPGSSIQSWNWWFDDGSTSTEQNPSKVFPFAGDYQVRLAVRSADGCLSDTFSKKVTVYVQPVIDAGPSFIVPEGTTIQFKPMVRDSTGLSYLWSPAFALSNATDLRPTLIATVDQVYKLTATGLGQCTASDTLSVQVMLPVNIPNAFSPNGDGINDTWRVDNLKTYPGNIVEIFNRLGQRVFRSQGYAKPWDGSIDGKPLPVGVYYYLIDLKNGFKQLAGYVTILK